MDKVIKVMLLMNNQILISQIEEVGADIGEPDCKLIKPCIVTEYKEATYTLTPFMLKLTKQETFMMSSDKILTLADPMPTLLEKYQDLIK
jgi:hypothetical protein